jgi:hypothetical protein
MATKVEKEAVQSLLNELKTVESWFIDTGYPRRSLAAYNEVTEKIKQVFKIHDHGQTDEFVPIDKTQ